MGRELALPDRWIVEFELQDEIEQVADDLVHHGRSLEPDKTGAGANGGWHRPPAEDYADFQRKIGTLRESAPTEALDLLADLEFRWALIRTDADGARLRVNSELFGGDSVIEPLTALALAGKPPDAHPAADLLQT